jgi:hypothetical protein
VSGEKQQKSKGSCLSSPHGPILASVELITTELADILQWRIATKKAHKSRAANALNTKYHLDGT